MDKIKVAVCGATGKMGRALIEMIDTDSGLELGGALEVADNPAIGRAVEGLQGNESNVNISSDVSSVVAISDVMIDFTRPKGTLTHLEQCVLSGTSIVIGTTGFTKGQLAIIEEASRSIPVMMAPNMSVGVNVLFKLVEMAAEALGEDCDVEITEAHHKHKIDAPSGTALKMGEVIAEKLGRDLDSCAIFGRQGDTGERDAKTIGFATVRAGDIVGEHTALFAGLGERLEITHRASSRANFASGALRAAKFLCDKKYGLYDMRDVLGL